MCLWICFFGDTLWDNGDGSSENLCENTLQKVFFVKFQNLSRKFNLKKYRFLNPSENRQKMTSLIKKKKEKNYIMVTVFSQI
jgi:hypothetical protein